MKKSYLTMLAGLIAFGGVLRAQDAPPPPEPPKEDPVKVEPADSAEKKPEEAKPEPKKPKADADKQRKERVEAWKKRAGELRDKAKEGAAPKPPGPGAGPLGGAAVKAKGEAVFNALDTDKDGAISEAEFLAAVEKAAKGVFSKVDADKDGKVAKEEAEKAAKTVLAKVQTLRAHFEQGRKGPGAGVKPEGKPAPGAKAGPGARKGKADKKEKAFRGQRENARPGFRAQSRFQGFSRGGQGRDFGPRGGQGRSFQRFGPPQSFHQFHGGRGHGFPGFRQGNFQRGQGFQGFAPRFQGQNRERTPQFQGPRGGKVGPLQGFIQRVREFGKAAFGQRGTQGPSFPGASSRFQGGDDRGSRSNFGPRGGQQGGQGMGPGGRFEGQGGFPGPGFRGQRGAFGPAGEQGRPFEGPEADAPRPPQGPAEGPVNGGADLPPPPPAPPAPEAAPEPAPAPEAQGPQGPVGGEPAKKGACCEEAEG